MTHFARLLSVTVDATAGNKLGRPGTRYCICASRAATRFKRLIRHFQLSNSYPRPFLVVPRHVLHDAATTNCVWPIEVALIGGKYFSWFIGHTRVICVRRQVKPRNEQDDLTNVVFEVRVLLLVGLAPSSNLVDAANAARLTLLRHEMHTLCLTVPHALPHKRHRLTMLVRVQ